MTRICVLPIPAELAGVFANVVISDDGSVDVQYAGTRVLRNIVVDDMSTMMSALVVRSTVSIRASSPPATVSIQPAVAGDAACAGGQFDAVAGEPLTAGDDGQRQALRRCKGCGQDFAPRGFAGHWRGARRRLRKALAKGPEQ